MGREIMKDRKRGENDVAPLKFVKLFPSLLVKQTKLAMEKDPFLKFISLSLQNFLPQFTFLLFSEPFMLHSLFAQSFVILIKVETVRPCSRPLFPSWTARHRFY
jgi:hypothetical protein